MFVCMYGHIHTYICNAIHKFVAAYVFVIVFCLFHLINKDPSDCNIQDCASVTECTCVISWIDVKY